MGKDLKGKELGKGISQRPDGRYIARYTTRFGKRKTIYNFKLNDLKKELREAIYEDEHGLSGDGESVTVDKWYHAWTELYKANVVKESTINTNNIYYNSRIKPEFGDMYLKDIKLHHIQQWINNLIDSGLASSTIENYAILLREMLEKAVHCEYIPKNPCYGMVIPRRKKHEGTVLTIDEQNLFFNVAASYKYINILKLAVTTGCRIGEILGLKWTDCDFENRVININKTLQYSKRNNGKKCEFFYTTAKTSSSLRCIPMTDEIYQILTNEKMRQLGIKAGNKNKWNPPEEFKDLVFTRKNGMPVYYRDVNNKIKYYVNYINDTEKALAEEEGRPPVIFPKFTCHTLRHTYSTRCYEKGMDFLVLQKLMGHSNVQMTANVYTHVSNEIKNKEAEKITILS